MTRDDIIAGLRAAADYLEANPEVPADEHAPSMVWHFVGHAFGDRDSRRTEVDRVAALIGAPVEGAGEHYEAELRFGPVAYKVCAIGAGDTPAEPVASLAAEAVSA